ncbi:GNAT family N-acetyltransferase [Bacillus sp. SL00103]
MEKRRLAGFWLCYDPNHPQKEGFIYNFIIRNVSRKRLCKAGHCSIRGRGKSLGSAKLSLHVFAHNQIARSLYEKTGFEETGIYI